MLEIKLIPVAEFDRIRAAALEADDTLHLLADMCRANALATVKRAGSGHLGSSFSSLDIVTLLYFSEMNLTRVGLDHPDRDIYFSSKGHDVPSHYAVLYALGLLDEHRFINLRRLGGTHGHPDLSIPAIEANSGSLGMGISKAKGMAIAKKLKGAGGRVFVMTGDGELQEGQIWESLQTVTHQKITNITVIVDCNKIQTDKPVTEIIDLGILEAKFRAFGWHVARCDGHDFGAMRAALRGFDEIGDQPKVLIADTIKGRGVSFMEGPASLKAGQGLYRWHSGAPDDEAFAAGYAEIIESLNSRLQGYGITPLKMQVIEQRQTNRTRLKDTAEKVVTAFGEALVDIGRERSDVVVLDADLSADCGLRPFEAAFPERFIENGIAEQDMVSTAGGLALQGFLPIVNSFGVFLASRANEQIYNNATEKTKIIYVCHYAGLIPAGPGKSHQSLRDISLFGALAELHHHRALQCGRNSGGPALVRPACDPDLHAAPDHLAVAASRFALPGNYRFTPGQGTVIREGADAVLFAYGPVMLNEALERRGTP